MPQTTIPYDQYFFERLGPVLKERRQKLGFTQKQLAEKVGISPSYVGYIEKGAPSLDLTTFADLLETLGFEYAFKGGTVTAACLELTPSEDPAVALPNVTVEEPFTPQYVCDPLVEDLTVSLPVEERITATPRQSPGLLNDFSMWFKRRFC